MLPQHYSCFILIKGRMVDVEIRYMRDLEKVSQPLWSFQDIFPVAKSSDPYELFHCWTKPTPWNCYYVCFFEDFIEHIPWIWTRKVYPKIRSVYASISFQSKCFKSLQQDFCIRLVVIDKGDYSLKELNVPIKLGSQHFFSENEIDIRIRFRWLHIVG